MISNSRTNSRRRTMIGQDNGQATRSSRRKRDIDKTGEETPPKKPVCGTSMDKISTSSVPSSHVTSGPLRAPSTISDSMIGESSVSSETHNSFKSSFPTSLPTSRFDRTLSEDCYHTDKISHLRDEFRQLYAQQLSTLSSIGLNCDSPSVFNLRACADDIYIPSDRHRYCTGTISQGQGDNQVIMKPFTPDNSRFLNPEENLESYSNHVFSNTKQCWDVSGKRR